jgi:hypothetical protein
MNGPHPDFSPSAAPVAPGDAQAPNGDERRPQTAERLSGAHRRFQSKNNQISESSENSTQHSGRGGHVTAPVYAPFVESAEPVTLACPMRTAGEGRP